MELDDKLLGSIEYPDMYKRISFAIFCSLLLFVSDNLILSADHKLLIVISFNFPHIITALEILLLITLTESVDQKFEIVNNIIDNQRTASVNLRKVLHRSSLEAVEKFKQQEKAFTMQVITDVVETHYRLILLSEEMNELFEYPILITMAFNFALITICVYYLFAESFKATRKFIEITNVIMWSIFLSVEIVLVLRCFQKISQKVTAES